MNNFTKKTDFYNTFVFKPSCLDAAYERKAMSEGLVDNPVFEENKIEFRILNQSED